VISTSNTAPIRIFPRLAGAGLVTEDPAFSGWTSGRADRVSFGSVFIGGDCTDMMKSPTYSVIWFL
jgi:hypothetical protein